MPNAFLPVPFLSSVPGPWDPLGMHLDILGSQESLHSASRQQEHMEKALLF